jgi:hypothetical protein
VTYLRGSLCGVASISAASFGLGVLPALREIDQQKAIGLGAVAGGLIENLISPQFWLLAILFFGLFFAASRLTSKTLRVVLFWAPTLILSTLGFAFVALLAVVWMHLRNI